MSTTTIFIFTDLFKDNRKIVCEGNLKKNIVRKTFPKVSSLLTIETDLALIIISEINLQNLIVSSDMPFVL